MPEISDEALKKLHDEIASLKKQLSGKGTPKKDEGDEKDKKPDEEKEKKDSKDLDTAKQDYKDLLQSKMDAKDLDKLTTLKELQIAYSVLKGLKLDQSDYNPAPPDKSGNAKTDSRPEWERPEVK